MRLGLVVFLAACVVLLQGCHQESYWERTLAGPFPGEPYSGELSTLAASSLQLTPQLVLETHWVGATNDPILCLRQAKGTSLWARVLVPRFEGQPQPHGRITDLKLKSAKAAEGGFKVLLDCNWTAGGKERGLIYLDTNYFFRSFALGW